MARWFLLLFMVFAVDGFSQLTFIAGGEVQRKAVPSGRERYSPLFAAGYKWKGFSEYSRLIVAAEVRNILYAATTITLKEIGNANDYHFRGKRINFTPEYLYSGTGKFYFGGGPFIELGIGDGDERYTITRTYQSDVSREREHHTDVGLMLKAEYFIAERNVGFGLRSRIGFLRPVSTFDSSTETLGLYVVMIFEK